MPRLGHKKSRLGCRQCKARHVKCDENKPCSNCARHGVSCSLMSWDPGASQTPASSASGSSGSSTTIKQERKPPVDKARSNSSVSASSPSLLIDYVLNPSVTSREDEISDASSPSSYSDHFPFLTKFVQNSVPAQPDLWVRDMELMHHWSIESFDELSQRHDMRHVWRVICPRHAVNHPFLMHEILAFAAFHKAYQQPEKMQEYYTLGIHHQDGAIKIMRPKLQNVTPQEAPAIVATSTLLTLSVFASSGIEAKCQETTGTWSAIDNILNIFSLMQGMGSVLAVVHTHVLSSWLAPMFKDPSEVTPSQPMLQEVINHAPTLISFIQSKSDLPEMERNAYLSVIGHLESVLQLAMPARVDNRELRFLFFWPLHLEPNFLVWLRERRPGALVIIMYYATMLFAAESRYWFIDSWGHRLMKACHEQLDRSWLPAVQWPLSFLSQTSPWNLFSHKIMNERLPGFTSASTHEQEVSTLPYTQQVPRTMIYRQYGSSPLAANEQRSVSSTAPHTKCTPSITSPPRSQHSTTSRTTYATTPSDEVG